MYWAVSFAVLQVQRALRTIFTLFKIRIIIINLLSPLRLHTISSIQIPQSTNRYNSMLPSVYVSPLKLYLATKIDLHGISGSAFFRNHLKVRVSPLKSPVYYKVQCQDV